MTKPSLKTYTPEHYYLEHGQCILDISPETDRCCPHAKMENGVLRCAKAMQTPVIKLDGLCGALWYPDRLREYLRTHSAA